MDKSSIIFGNEIDRKTLKTAEKSKKLAQTLHTTDITGIYAICNDNIFQAVYSTNLLMKECDWLVTKPSELAYYPIPKIFMRHIGGHEIYGAIHSSEIGDGLWECPTTAKITKMLDRVLTDKEILCHLANQINTLKAQGYYNELMNV